MSKQTKIWLIIAFSLILSGCMLFGGVMMIAKWDFTKLSTVKFEAHNYEFDEQSKSIFIETDTADIKFLPSENSKISVTCYEQKNMKHSVYVENGTLNIKLSDNRHWYEYIGITIGSPKLTVYLPENEYASLAIKGSTCDVEIPDNFKFESIDVSVSTGDVESLASATKSVKIKTSTGKITAKNINCTESIEIKVSTGKTNLENIVCKNLTATGTTGDITLKNVIASGAFSVKLNTGDVKLQGCDANELIIKTSTGDVKGSLLTEKIFIAHTDTGKVNVPETLTGGKCSITTDTGDIEIKIP